METGNRFIGKIKLAYQEKIFPAIKPRIKKSIIFLYSQELWKIGAVTIIFLSLSLLYSIHPITKELVENWDFWFGCDTVLYILWMEIPDYVERAYLHPATLAVFKSYSWFLRKAGILPNYNFLPVLAFPVVLYTAISTVLSVKMILSGQAFPNWLKTTFLVLMLVIGPLIVFAVVPESHLLGGVSLLMQTIFTWYYLKINRYEQSPNKGLKGGKVLIVIIFFAFLATGFSLSNLMPATLMVFALPNFRRGMIKIAVFGIISIVILYVIHYYVITLPYVYPIKKIILNEIPWLVFPGLDSFSLSIRYFLLSQFGLSSPYLAIAVPPSTDEGVYLALSKPSFLQVLACLLWIGGILIWLYQNVKRNNSEFQFIIFCFLSLLSLILFHSVYAVNESYMFSSHGWPFLIIPGLIVLKNSWIEQNTTLFICLLVAGGLSAIQLVIGIYHLLSLEPIVL